MYVCVYVCVSVIFTFNICINKNECLCISDKAVELLVSCLSCSSSDIHTIGASALWALLHNNQKVTFIQWHSVVI